MPTRRHLSRHCVPLIAIHSGLLTTGLPEFPGKF